MIGLVFPEPLDEDGPDEDKPDVDKPDEDELDEAGQGEALPPQPFGQIKAATWQPIPVTGS